MTYLPITGLDQQKNISYIPIQGLGQEITPPISTSSAVSTTEISPKGVGFFSGVKSLVSSAYQGAKKLISGAVEKAPIVKFISYLEAGMPLTEAFKKSQTNIENQVKVKKEQLDIRNKLIAQGKNPEEATKIAMASLTETQMNEATNMVAGFLGGLENKAANEARKKLSKTAAKDIVEKIVPKIEENPVSKIINAIKEAKPVRKEQEAIYSAERAKRAAKVAEVGEKVKGEQGYFAQLGQLKGELPKAQYESIRKSFNQNDIDQLFNMVEDSPTLLLFEKVSAKTALTKLLGSEGGVVPTKSEISLLNEIFPKELTQAIMDKMPLSSKIMRGIGEVLNVPRALMASFDFSAPLRQGVFLVGKPSKFIPAFKDMFKYAFSEKAYDGLIEGIKKMPTYKLMREGGLALTDKEAVSLTGREEMFMSHLAEKIPVIGKVVKISDRAYTGFLNKMRADVFNDIISKAKNVGVELDEKLVKDTAKFVNSATGRGDLGVLNKAAVPLNSLFFSPRLMASRLNLLNPYFYTTLSPVVRKEAIKSLLSFGAIAGSILGLAELGGAEVSSNANNADFGKIKTGNTRYDILGGFQQYIRLASELITGKIVSSTSGREITLGEGYKPLTRKDILLRFFENKESPIASFATGLLQGQTSIGQSFDVKSEIASRFIPMVVNDMYDLYQEGGLKGLVGWLPSPFGVGTQTYGKQELAFGENPIGEQTAQVRPVQGLTEKLTENLFGKQPLGSSNNFNVETYFDQLQSLQRDQAKDVFNKISEANPDLAKQLSDVVIQREKGITPHDLDLKSKGVASGDRATAILKDLNKLKTKEEKVKLWQDYVNKGVITADVSKQLMTLLKK
jgi:hypothetical protein